MAWKYTFLCLAALVPFAAATPVDATSLSVAVSQPPGATTLETSLQKRDCDTIGAVLDSISNGSELAVYATTVGVTALYVCRRTSAPDCDILSSAIAGLFASIFLIIKRSTGSENTNDSKRAVASMAEFLSIAFQENGQSFASIEDKTQPLQPRSDASYDRQPLEITGVKGLSFENHTIDFDVYDFGSGEGLLHMPLNGNSDSGSLDKRAAAPAIKVSYRTFKKSAFDRHQQIMGSQKIASAWALAANEGGISNYIGLVESNGSADFYWRVIPELQAFGTNFERTDICGNLDRWV